jgi:hypothetical protein
VAATGQNWLDPVMVGIAAENDDIDFRKVVPWSIRDSTWDFLPKLPKSPIAWFPLKISDVWAQNVAIRLTIFYTVWNQWIPFSLKNDLYPISS